MISSKLFDSDWDTNSFVAEISDLGPQPFWNTGEGGNTFVDIHVEDVDKILTFRVVGVDRDEGDITAWRLAATEKTLEAFPKLVLTKMVIFND